ncbi:MAG: DsbA family protein [Deltaproteobacteria bacterium]|nr:DsbA family protein [Deltaproteobacteria bacterium]
MFLLLAMLLPMIAHADGALSIKGVYKEVPGAQFKYDGKTVEVMEFLSFYCSHCFAFEKAVPVIKGNFPKRIKWRVMPVYWGTGSSVPGEAYLLAEDAGKGEQMKKALFDASFRDKLDIGKYEVVESLAMEVGLGFDFSRKLRSGEKALEAGNILNLARTYGVEGTPTFIIAGNLKADTEAFGSDTSAIRENIITIVKSVLESKGSKAK